MPLRNPQELPTVGKLLAIDMGAKTLGLATCDSLRMVATPQKTLIRTKWGKDRSTLQTFISKENIIGIVLGLPITLGGTDSAQTRTVLSFAGNLEHDLNLPVLLWDERLTTVAAEAALFEQRTGRQTRASKKDVKEHVDSVAAALILQGVLDFLRNRLPA